jgi:hypothetical protein
VNDDGGEGSGGGDGGHRRGSAASSSRWPRSPLDSHRPRESTAREMCDVVAHDCWRPYLLRVSSICSLCAKGALCRCGWACLLETVSETKLVGVPRNRNEGDWRRERQAVGASVPHKSRRQSRPTSVHGLMAEASSRPPVGRAMQYLAAPVL